MIHTVRRCTAILALVATPLTACAPAGPASLGGEDLLAVDPATTSAVARTALLAVTAVAKALGIQGIGSRGEWDTAYWNDLPGSDGLQKIAAHQTLLFLNPKDEKELRRALEAQYFAIPGGLLGEAAFARRQRTLEAIADVARKHNASPNDVQQLLRLIDTYAPPKQKAMDPQAYLAFQDALRTLSAAGSDPAKQLTTAALAEIMKSALSLLDVVERDPLRERKRKLAAIAYAQVHSAATKTGAKDALKDTLSALSKHFDPNVRAQIENSLSSASVDTKKRDAIVSRLQAIFASGNQWTPGPDDSYCEEPDRPTLCGDGTQTGVLETFIKSRCVSSPLACVGGSFDGNRHAECSALGLHADQITICHHARLLWETQCRTIPSARDTNEAAQLGSNLLPLDRGLNDGFVYSECCQELHYRHCRQPEFSLPARYFMFAQVPGGALVLRYPFEDPHAVVQLAFRDIGLCTTQYTGYADDPTREECYEILNRAP